MFRNVAGLRWGKRIPPQWIYPAGAAPVRSSTACKTRHTAGPKQLFTVSSVILTCYEHKRWRRALRLAFIFVGCSYQHTRIRRVERRISDPSFSIQWHQSGLHTSKYPPCPQTIPQQIAPSVLCFWVSYTSFADTQIFINVFRCYFLILSIQW